MGYGSYQSGTSEDNEAKASRANPASAQGSQYQGNGNNNVPVSSLSNVGALPQQQNLTVKQARDQHGLGNAQAMINDQNFIPRAPNSAGGWMSMLGSPFSPFAKSFIDQSRYGMSPASQSIYDNLDPRARAELGTPQDQVNYARNLVSRQQAAPQGYSGGQGGQGGQGGGGAIVPNGTPDAGTFNPVTFRNGNTGGFAGTDGMAGLIGKGTGLFGQAGDMAQQTPDQFSYDFNPEQAGQDLYAQRAALLEPQFAQMNAQNNESMFGSGRLGLRLAGDGVGAGSGMVQPDAFGMNQAQAQALAQLSAQSTNDAYSQELQRAGLDMNQFGVNQGLQQQQFGNLMSAGGGMFDMGVGNVGLQQQQQALDQNYELGKYGNETARITGQAQANKANYQPDPWLTGAIGLGTSFLGTDKGSSWLSTLFGG
jgi:hypothetical protein